ncbi:MAG: hypothetical protein U0794_02865 [Isosphaeraceae bacterium]
MPRCDGFRWMGVGRPSQFGYLITAIILRHGGSRGFLSSFYIRRGLRVWPYFLVVGLVVATAPRTETRRTGLVCLTRSRSLRVCLCTGTDMPPR